MAFHCNYCSRSGIVDMTHDTKDHSLRVCEQMDGDYYLPKKNPNKCRICDVNYHTTDNHKCDYCKKRGPDSHKDEDCPDKCRICSSNPTIFYATKHTTNDHICSLCHSSSPVAHFYRECPNVCYICGQQHSTAKHKCNVCQKIGVKHIDKNCPERCTFCDKLHTTANHHCERCRYLGHAPDNCPKHCEYCTVVHATAEHYCYVCGGRGHPTKSCPQRCRLCNGDHQTARHICPICEQEGVNHTKVECPERCLRCLIYGLGQPVDHRTDRCQQPELNYGSTELFDQNLSHLALHSSTTVMRDPIVIRSLLVGKQEEIEKLPYWRLSLQALFPDEHNTISFNDAIAHKCLAGVVMIALRYYKVTCDFNLPEITPDFLQIVRNGIIMGSSILGLLGHPEDVITKILMDSRSIGLRGALASHVPKNVSGRELLLTMPRLLLEWADQSLTNKIQALKEFVNFSNTIEGRDFYNELNIDPERMFPIENEWQALYDQLFARSAVNMIDINPQLDWTVTEFTDLGISRLVSVNLIKFLTKENVNRSLVSGLKDEHLKTAGVSTLGDQMRLLAYFEKK